MGCPRIVLLNVTTVTFIVIALCTHTYMYTCPAPFGADGLINKINLFNSTGVTESYIAKILPTRTFPKFLTLGTPSMAPSVRKV